VSDLIMATETVSFLKKNAADLPLNEPLTITQNGKPAYVVESYEQHQRKEQAIALLKLVSFAKSDVANGCVMSSGTLKERLAARKQ
jgi:PHD/YefM family antitoxin component YafN of YafNO toxin-antitoxin module